MPLATAVAEVPEDWRATMPMWAHMRWWLVQEQYAGTQLIEFIGPYTDSEGEYGYVRFGWPDSKATFQVLVARK